MKNRGFTLIELLLVVALMLIIGTASVPFYSRFFTQNSVGNTADKIIQLTRKAQFYAMTSKRSNTTGWGIYYTNRVLTMYLGNSYATKISTWDETYTVDNSVTVTQSGNNTFEINFARITGIPTPTSVNIAISGNQGTNETLTMNALGMITR
jgi:prepilin-type N-terminal cleavage/methylation domain-containing protein